MVCIVVLVKCIKICHAFTENIFTLIDFQDLFTTLASFFFGHTTFAVLENLSTQIFGFF